MTTPNDIGVRRNRLVLRGSFARRANDDRARRAASNCNCEEKCWLANHVAAANRSPQWRESRKAPSTSLTQIVADMSDGTRFRNSDCGSFNCGSSDRGGSELHHPNGRSAMQLV